MSSEVDPGGEPQVYALRLVEAICVHVELVRASLSPQELLGKRWPLIRAFGLLSDKGHGALKAFLAQRLSGFGAGEAGADDDEIGGSRSRCQLCTSRPARARRCREPDRRRPDGAAAWRIGPRADQPEILAGSQNGPRGGEAPLFTRYTFGAGAIPMGMGSVTSRACARASTT